MGTYWQVPLPLQAHQRPSFRASPGQQPTPAALSGNGPLAGQSSLSVFLVVTSSAFHILILFLFFLKPDVLHFFLLKGGV